MNIHPSILGTIGNTPVVRLVHIAPAGVEVCVKIEAFNPAGSIKDRLALGVIEAAERDGSLRPGQTVIEASSGNTGIGLAMVCAVKGYPLVVTMAENFSIERRKLMRMLGARVVLTPASEKGTGMLAKACELAEAHGWFLARQFENEANPDIHSITTAEEILSAFDGKGPDVFVCGLGTGGTMKGVARVLRARAPHTRIVACEPENSPLLASGIPQPKDASHPAFRPHLMQGWSPDFIPKLAQDVLDLGLIDEIRGVEGRDALDTAHALARREGILCGISSGATLAVALDIAREAAPGTRILAVLPDTGERYLSTPLFADIPEAMSEEERAISASTPSCRFDRPRAAAPAAAVAAAPPPDAPPEMIDELDGIIRNRNEPVVMFALEWCEFCWSVRRFFTAAGIAYRSVDLDGPAWRSGNRAGEMRAALHRLTGSPTIPQVFVAGRHIGGAMETLSAFKEHSLVSELADLGIAIDPAALPEPQSFLPAWLQPRGT
ncbi:cysteine synthase A [Aestuariivirga sp.]|uniref:cysteine synthase A n=1 Tax=Aestuariivirga sp. TaxID=2650926 RepID=UPI00391C7EE7